jgi:hypothetical protein
MPTKQETKMVLADSKGTSVVRIEAQEIGSREEMDEAIDKLAKLRSELGGRGEVDVNRELCEIARHAMNGPATISLAGGSLTEERAHDRWRRSLAIHWAMIRALATTPEQHRLADYLGAEHGFSRLGEDVEAIGRKVGARCIPTRIAEIREGWAIVRADVLEKGAVKG